MDKEMERRLYDATTNGDLAALLNLLQQDPSLLKRVTLNRFNETLLHISVIHGHENLVKEILKQNPQLAEEIDSCKMTPLHVASPKGYIEMVKALLAVNSNMCVARDRDGRNPLHLSAMKGRVEVLKVLVKERFNAAVEKINNGQTILHLCIKHDQLECLKLLMEAINDGEFVNAKDEEGNTILHLAVSDKQIETIKYLLTSSSIDSNQQNTHGETALDILARDQRDATNLAIIDTLREAGGLRGQDLPKSSNNRNGSTTINSRKNNVKEQKDSTRSSSSEDWLEKQRSAVMIVATIIAQMAFQAGLNPPGGVLQDDKTVEGHSYKAGEAVLATTNAQGYKRLVRADTTALASSLLTILLLLSGFSLKQKLVMWILLVIMWLTITALGLTYIWSIAALAPGHLLRNLCSMTDTTVIAWLSVTGFLLIGTIIRLIVISIRKTIKKRKGMGIRIRKWFHRNRQASSSSTNTVEP